MLLLTEKKQGMKITEEVVFEEHTEEASKAFELDNGSNSRISLNWLTKNIFNRCVFAYPKWICNVFITCTVVQYTNKTG